MIETKAIGPTDKDVRCASKWAEIYREMDLNVLPSRMDEKRPLVKFADYWEKKHRWDIESYRTSNIQIMTGTFWNFCVLDLDGQDAVQEAEKWRLPRTWEVYSSNRGKHSRHLWFRLPDGCEPRGRAILWGVVDETGAWKKRSMVEFLCDRCLIVAPPSIHAKTGERYGFAPGHSPREMALPAFLPKRIWDMKPLSLPRQTDCGVKFPASPPASSPGFGHSRDWRRVIESLPILAVVESFGLRVVKNCPHRDGWLPCHDFNREDRTPSASINVISGRFWRPGMAKGETLSLFELGVQMGHYGTWHECLDALADHYGIV